LEVSEVVGELARGCVAALGIFCYGLEADCNERLRNARAFPGRREIDFPIAPALKEFLALGFRKRRAAEETFLKGDAQ
jgi:hypothetical protein